jgi:ribonuclease E
VEPTTQAEVITAAATVPEAEITNTADTQPAAEIANTDENPVKAPAKSRAKPGRPRGRRKVTEADAEQAESVKEATTDNDVSNAMAPAALVKTENAPAEIVVSAKPVVETVNETAVAAVKITPVKSASRFGNMVVADMAKPATSTTDIATADTPSATAAERPAVSSSSRQAGSAFARQAASAPMTKPDKAE